VLNFKFVGVESQSLPPKMEAFGLLATWLTQT
jgi:hypothetical protein